MYNNFSSSLYPRKYNPRSKAMMLKHDVLQAAYVQMHTIFATQLTRTL